MKIAAVIASFGIDFGLDAAFKIVCDTLKETGENVQIFNLANSGLDHYSGFDSTQKIMDTMESIKDADGIIFAFPSIFNMPGALALTFLEYFTDETFDLSLQGKPFLLLSISENGGERAALQCASDAILQLGGHDVVRIALNAAAASVVKGDVIELIERQTEDFYRILRQNRRYVYSLPKTAASGRIMQANSTSNAARTPINLDEIYKKHKLDNITDEQQGDIDKITEMFA
ncbi:MAG: NAD(P)H-dependent oxidoreductase, partial [Defluviitaleaceae bacterium]|nr:NAD(P)H-dependent oxidoreductase [Defluviitaleaceae bacterium]